MGIFDRLTPRCPPPPRTAPGERVYAIGDVHGRLDLVEELLGAVRRDDAEREAARTTIVFLGDLVDRGPESAGVIARLMAGLGWAELVCLMGNHEALLIGALAGHEGAGAVWLRNGGIATLASWGVADDALATGSVDDLLAEGRRLAPEAQRAWLAERPAMWANGDYRFVHAGIRPGVALDEQVNADMLWIRKPFLESRRDHGAVIVHGHSVREEAEFRADRIGIDTGAYASGRLTALGLDGEARWLLQTGAAPDRDASALP